MMPLVTTLRVGLWRTRASLSIWLAVPTLFLYFTVPIPAGSRSAADTWWWLVVAGAAIGFVLWLVFGFLGGREALPRSANQRSYDELLSRQTAATMSLKTVPIVADAAPSEARERVSQGLEAIKAALESTGPAVGWASGESYISTWEELHRAEEELLLLRDRGAVVAEAEMDKLRLTGSRMANEKECSSMLDAAITGLKDNDEGCRQTIRIVRKAVNEYVDSRCDGLVRLGITLRRWRLLLGLVVYAMFVVAILSVDRSPRSFLVESFAVYFLIGTGAGAVHEIWKRQSDQPVVDDYGVSEARFLLTPALCGSAACGGVLLVWLLIEGSLAGLLQAPAIAVDYTQLSVAVNPALAIVAAIFGLAPGRLLGALDTIGDSLTSAIDAAEPTGASGDDSGK